AQMATKGIRYTVDTLELKNRWVLCDENRLSRVLLNLISNAYKFTPKDGSVSVSLRDLPDAHEGHGNYELRVKDSGIGMSEEFAARVFNAFERERTSTVSGIQGTGLGMAITKSIVDLMHGSIKVATAQGQGTEFIVRLQFPLAENPEHANEEKTTEFLSKEADFTKSKLLLVDDIDVNREIAKMLLETAGFHVDTAENGKEALEKIAASRPGDYDAVLMDIQMPVMDGYAATQAIRALPDPDLAHIPILAMTANAFSEDVETAKAAGMDGHIAKPLDVPKMMETLAEVLSKKNV
ncbi:MAG: response regulator, partial [Selenomonadaceae bacterium]|nr:response regulator [Selenomonadaceae bacterium]